MRRFLARTSDKAGVAAVELALVAPFLATILVCTADFSIAYHKQLQMSSALAAGAEYAFAAGQTESGAALTADAAGFVNKVSAFPLTSVTASYNNGLSAASCYCVNGSPASYTGPLTCGAACTDGSGSTAGKFVAITASFTYAPIFSADQVFFASPYAQTVTVRLQ